MRKNLEKHLIRKFVESMPLLAFWGLITLLSGCSEIEAILFDDASKQPIQIILDSDTNNELDDQHAIAYLLSNPEYFDLQGITVNKTTFGGSIDDQFVEAKRVVELCAQPEIGVFKGAAGNYKQIKPEITKSNFDGSEAVAFIIAKARASVDEKLVILAVGKLTNVALALLKEPAIAEKIRVVWLGSNYPHPREYNLINDVDAVNAVLESDVEFEMITVREGMDSGTANVVVYVDDINDKMPGKGPAIASPVKGRNGKLFSNFGDYSVGLFKLFPGAGSPPGRSFYDVAAVSILKKPYWAERVEISAPLLSEQGNWIEQPDNPRKIVYWENFEKNKIKRDFYESMEDFIMQKPVASTNGAS